MKRILFSCIAVMFLLLPLARGEVFNTATVLRTGHFSLNFEGQREFGPDENMFFLHLGMGLIDAKSDLCITFGFPSDEDRDTYKGLDLEFVLNRTGPAISFTAGIHEQEWKGVDLRLLMSGKFDSFRPYIGFDSDYDFAEHDNQDDFWFMNLVLGFEARFSTNAGFILEYAAEVASSRDADFDEADSSYISLGVAVYF